MTEKPRFRTKKSLRAEVQHLRDGLFHMYWMVECKDPGRELLAIEREITKLLGDGSD